jgi:phosphoglycerate dehydrogenase-like enzyme
LTTAGHDNVLGIRSDLNITFSPGAGSRTVAEHGLGLILALTRGLTRCMASQAAGSWDNRISAYVQSMRGKRILMIGFGSVGKRLAELLRAFETTIIAATRNGAKEAQADMSCSLDLIDAHLSLVDLVVIVVPLNAATHNLFNAGRLAKLSKNAFFVNLSRGAIVDNHALSNALNRGDLAGAALDVTDPEPLPNGHPLWSTRNAIITPHIAAAGQSHADQKQLADSVEASVRSFIAGERPDIPPVRLRDIPAPTSTPDGH